MKTVKLRDWLNSVRRVGTITRKAWRDIWPGNGAVMVRLASVSFTLALLSYVVYWFYSRAIGAVASPLPATALWWLGGALLTSLLADALGLLRSYSERQFYWRAQEHFALQFASRKAGLGVDQLEESRFRDLVVRAQERDIWPLVNILESQFDNLNNLVRVIAALGIVAAYDWRLALLVCVALIPEFVVDVRHGHTLWGIFAAETETRRRYNEYRRHFQNRFFLTELKLFRNVSYFLERARILLEGFRHSQEAAERRKHLVSLGTALLNGLVTAAVMLIVLWRVTHGSMSLATFVFLWSSVGSLHTTLQAMLKTIARQNEWALEATDLYAVMEAEPESTRLTGTLPAPPEAPMIVFEGVWFRYPESVAKDWILKDVSFTLKPGERSAFVGINGAGKTTLVRLICGIYPPTKGRILVDGVDLREIAIDDWRRKLAVLFQEYTTYHAPVAEVIHLGDTSTKKDQDRVVEAAEASGAKEFIEKLTDGYRTMIGKEFDKGHELSGGQRQRLALARVFYRQGKLVILDEPTASLDALIEAEIFERIEEWPRTSSIILITHRFATIRHVDHIIVLNQGRVLEEGTHEELVANNQLYAQMFERQAAGYLA